MQYKGRLGKTSTKTVVLVSAISAPHHSIYIDTSQRGAVVSTVRGAASPGNVLAGFWKGNKLARGDIKSGGFQIIVIDA